MAVGKALGAFIFPGFLFLAMTFFFTGLALLKSTRWKTCKR